TTRCIADITNQPDIAHQQCAPGTGRMTVWDVSSWKPVHSFTGLNPITSLAFSKDGKLFASSGCAVYEASSKTSCLKGLIQLWNVTTWTPTAHPLIGHTSQVLSVDF